MKQILPYDPSCQSLDLGDERMVQRNVTARGTSEGVRKAWDKRGRGRKQKEVTTTKPPKKQSHQVEDYMKKMVGDELWNKYPVFKAAAQKMAGKIDSRFFTLGHLPIVSVVDELEFPAAVGVTNYGEGTITYIKLIGSMGKDLGEGDPHLLKGLERIGGADKASTETVIHELGHWWDNEVKYGFSTRKAGTESQETSDDLLEDRYKAADEERAEKDRVVAIAKAQGKCDSEGCDTDGIKLKAPSSYSLTNPEEWLADNSASYFYSPETKQKLKEDSPKTFDYLDKLYTGKYFIRGGGGIV